MARRHKQGAAGEPGAGQHQGISRNSSLDGSMNEVSSMIEGWFCVFFWRGDTESGQDLSWYYKFVSKLIVNDVEHTCWATPLNWDPLNLSTKWGGRGLWVLDTAWSCHQTDHNQGSARGPLQYVIKRAASALDHCFPEWSQQSKFTYHTNFSL